MLHTRLNEENSYYFNMCSIISVKNFHSPLLSLCLEQFLRVLFVLPWWLDAEAETPVLWPPHAKSWLTHWKRAWCWEGLGAGEGDDRGWDGWMASPTWWTWVWVSSRSWWWTGRPGVLRFMGSQRVGHDWATKLNWRWTKLVAQRVKSLPAMQETHVLSLGSFPGEGNGYPLQYSYLEIPMDTGASRATVHWVAQSGHDWATNTFHKDLLHLLVDR